MQTIAALVEVALVVVVSAAHSAVVRVPGPDRVTQPLRFVAAAAAEVAAGQRPSATERDCPAFVPVELALRSLQLAAAVADVAAAQAPLAAERDCPAFSLVGFELRSLQRAAAATAVAVAVVVVVTAADQIHPAFFLVDRALRRVQGRPREAA